MDVEFLPGDVVLASAKTGIFKLIGPLTREPGEEKTVATHTEAVAVEGTKESCKVVAPRSLWVGLHPFPGVGEKDPEDIYVFRHTGWNDEQRGRIGRALRRQVGNLYGAHRLIGFAADNLIARALGFFGYKGEIRLISRIHFLSDLRVCSNVVAGAIYAATGYRFGMNPEMVTPDEVWDWVAASPDWKLVYSHKWEAANG